MFSSAVIDAPTGSVGRITGVFGSSVRASSAVLFSPPLGSNADVMINGSWVAIRRELLSLGGRRRCSKRCVECGYFESWSRPKKEIVKKPTLFIKYCK